jgi:hypothetical protein
MLWAYAAFLVACSLATVQTRRLSRNELEFNLGTANQKLGVCMAGVASDPSSASVTPLADVKISDVSSTFANDMRVRQENLELSVSKVVDACVNSPSLRIVKATQEKMVDLGKILGRRQDTLDGQLRVIGTTRPELRADQERHELLLQSIKAGCAECILERNTISPAFGRQFDALQKRHDSLDRAVRVNQKPSDHGQLESRNLDAVEKKIGQVVTYAGQIAGSSGVLAKETKAKFLELAATIETLASVIHRVQESQTRLELKDPVRVVMVDSGLTDEELHSLALAAATYPPKGCWAEEWWILPMAIMCFGMMALILVIIGLGLLLRTTKRDFKRQVKLEVTRLDLGRLHQNILK